MPQRPLRNPQANAEVTDVSKTVDIPYKEKSAKDKLAYLAQVGLSYLSLKAQATKIKTETDKKNKEIKEKLVESELFDVNGNHKELHVPAGDGLNEVFIQIQGKESVSMVNDVVAQVRAKLGKNAEAFIMKVEVLHSDALEAMHNQGLITDEDVEEWTEKKITESLIVKLNKRKS